MNIVVLSGAVKNAGDYLIKNRTISLLKNIYSNCSITEYFIGKDLSEELDIINKQDIMIVPGGPVNFDEYPKHVPLVPELNQIKIPMANIGLGWYGYTKDSKDIYNYIYTDETKKYLKKISKSIGISCRDWYTVRTMRNNNIGKAIMTGCPAWYDLKYVDIDKLKTNISYKRISISDPAKIENKALIMPLVELLKKKYPDCQLEFVFHRGIEADKFTGKKNGELNCLLKKQLEERGVNVYDISYSDDGFKIYDDCDMHIGFRVHAHIYNLSHRKPSILIEEDGRGAGANEALGLNGITAYNMSAYNNCLQETIMINPLFVEEINDYLDNIELNDFRDYTYTFQRMQDYFELMLEHIKSFEKLI